MTDVVVVETDESDETPEAEAVEEVAEALEDVAEAQEDVVMDATTIGLVDRMARMEEHISATVDPTLSDLSFRVGQLESMQQFQQQEIQVVAEEVQEVATEAADALTETIDAVEEASEEITEDEVPTETEHRFFKKWGRS